MISFILPTHNRPEILARTLGKLGELNGDALPRGCEVLVVDNASDPPVAIDGRSRNGLVVRTIRRASNEAAAGRNVAAREAQNPWLIMLDDDSYPLNEDFVHVLNDAEDELAAIGAQILLPDGRREDGGLPEVFIGCGAAIRRDAFLAAGGYDPAFHYYGEEHDLAAKLIIAGWRIVHDFRFHVRHEKTSGGRDMNLILQRLVRNTAWVAQRYSPEPQRRTEIPRIIERYGRVAIRERAAGGFARGMAQLATSLPAQHRLEMNDAQHDRFCGLAAVRESLCAAALNWEITKVRIIAQGKNDWVVRQVLDELGVETATANDEADALVIGTISPGPMMDALQRDHGQAKPILAPWSPRHSPAPVQTG